MPYQLAPARLALQAPRPRILIADDLGLGKTIETGIPESELIARGRGKRILVVTTKAMLDPVSEGILGAFFSRSHAFG